MNSTYVLVYGDGHMDNTYCSVIETGVMATPWKGLNGTLKTIKIEYGVRNVTDCAFAYGYLDEYNDLMISGFESLRSFNRNFKAIMGTTPLVYKRSVRQTK